MIDICLFGREISDLVRVFGTSLRFILLSSVARGLLSVPSSSSRVTRAGSSSRRVYSFAACGTKDSSVSHTMVIVRLFCPADGTRRSDLVEGLRRGSIRPDVRVGQIFLCHGIFSALCVGLATNTTRLLGAFYRRDISRLAIVGLMLDNRRGAMS